MLVFLPVVLLPALLALMVPVEPLVLLALQAQMESVLVLLPVEQSDPLQVLPVPKVPVELLVLVEQELLAFLPVAGWDPLLVLLLLYRPLIYSPPSLFLSTL